MTAGFVFLAAAYSFAGQQPAPDDRASASSAKGNTTKPAPVASKDTAEKDAGNDSEYAALKKQVAEQQNQIDKLVLMVQQLERRLETREAAQRAPETSPAPQSSPDFPATGTVASLSPVVPAGGPSAKRELTSMLSPEPLGAGSPLAQSSNLAPTEKTAESKLSDLAHGKIKISGTFFADYAAYLHTGFGPQFLTQLNQAGPGNDGFNSFDVTRTYINVFYTPNEAVTLRITPNIYRQVDVSNAQSFGKGSAISSSSNGNLGFRLKYAYIELNHPFEGSKAFGKDKITFGQTPNPLVDWEENLYGYRFVNLTPWNYLSLSSTYVGGRVHGPVMVNGKEYLDYDLGVFNTASFHAIEQNDKKQVMGRLTWYPAGTTVDRTGMGLTVFEDYGYSTKTPDTPSIPLYRFAALAHYQSHDDGYGIAGEFDLGRNAFSTGNLFSGVGPADEFGLGPTPYATWDALARAILAGDRTRQRGFAFFGHARLGASPFTVFGMYEYFQPNTNVQNNPLDFAHIVAGVSYRYNQHLTLALDSQNLIYTKSQFTFPASQLATLSSSLAAENPNGIPNAVPKNTNAIFLNMLFNY
jgi:hypothetical protein